MVHKSKVFSIFPQFQCMVECYFTSKIKIIKSDWGGEYHKLDNFFAQLGIIHRLPCPQTHQQNGAIERRHCHIVQTSLSLLAHSSVPFKYWPFAFDTAVYFINRLPTKVLHGHSPLHKLFNQSPNCLSLRFLVVCVFLIFALITNIKGIFSFFLVCSWITAPPT